jgi:hypothetical protein
MPDVRHLAVQLLGRRDRRRAPPRAAALAGAESPRSVERLSAPGLAVAYSAGFGSHRIDVDGELTLVTARLLDTAAAAVYGTASPGRAEPGLVILDLGGVVRLDVLGVAALHRVHTRLRGRARLRVGPPEHPDPRRMLGFAVDHGWLAPVFTP